MKRLFFKTNKKNIYKFKKALEENSQFEVEQITEIVKTKYGEELLFYYSKNQEDYLKIKLYTIKNRGGLFANLLFNNDEMKIADINVLDKNISNGYGTILLEKAIEIARERGIKRITGSMAPKDENNKKRQIKFYSKYKFVIDENNIGLDL